MLFIFVEGDDDKELIKFLCAKINPGFSDLEIISTKGFTNLINSKPKFEEAKDFGQALVIFDADSKVNNGGYTVRKKYLDNLKKENSIIFESFLFPNNKDDGSLEDLLVSIVNPDHKKILNCFDNYERCLEKYKDDKGNNLYNLPLRKSKIYAYLDAFYKSNKEKEEFKKKNRFYSNFEYWDFKSVYIRPLEEFLIIYLKENK